MRLSLDHLTHRALLPLKLPGPQQQKHCVQTRPSAKWLAKRRRRAAGRRSGTHDEEEEEAEEEEEEDKHRLDEAEEDEERQPHYGTKSGRFMTYRIIHFPTSSEVSERASK